MHHPGWDRNNWEWSMFHLASNKVTNRFPELSSWWLALYTRFPAYSKGLYMFHQVNSMPENNRLVCNNLGYYMVCNSLGRCNYFPEEGYSMKVRNRECNRKEYYKSQGCSSLALNSLPEWNNYNQ